MSYELGDIEDALATILGDVDGIGKVHKRNRWTNDQVEFKQFFLVPSTKLINGCCITLERYRPIRVLSSKFERQFTMKIWFVHSYSDKKNTDDKFKPLMVNVCDAINSHFKYLDAWHLMAEDGDAQMTRNQIRKWAGLFVHYAEIVVTVEVRS